MSYQLRTEGLAGHTCRPALYGPGCRCGELGRIMAQRCIDHATCDPSTMDAEGRLIEHPWADSPEGLRCGADGALVVPTPEYLRAHPRWPGVDE